MRAMDIVRAGDKGFLEMAERTIAPPAKGEVQIRVAYSGVNRADLYQVAGSYAPPEGVTSIPGMEVAGTIEALGEGVVGWSAGEEVCALISGGGYAEYVNAPASQVLSLPRAVDLKESASLPEACATAFMALSIEAGLRPGERVLLHGGASGVGIIMAQVARAWGAEVFATAGGQEKCDVLAHHGIRAIDHRAAPFAQQVEAATHGEGVDVIIDTLGAKHLAEHFALLKRGGRLVSLAFLDGNVVESLKIAPILTRSLSWSGTTLRGKSAAQKAEIVEGVKKSIWPYLATGLIRPLIDRVFPLEAAEKAHLRMEERLHIGKILLEVHEITNSRGNESTNS